MKVDPYHGSLISTRDTLAHDKLKPKVSFGYVGGRTHRSRRASTYRWLPLSTVSVASTSAGTEFKPFNMATAAQYFTLDSLLKVAYGYAFCFLATDFDMFDYVSESRKLLPVLVMSAEVS